MFTQFNTKIFFKTVGGIGTLGGLTSTYHLTKMKLENDSRLKERELILEEQKHLLERDKFEFEKEKWNKQFQELLDSKSSSNTQTISSQSNNSNSSSENITVDSIYEWDLFNTTDLNLTQFVGFVELLIGSMVLLSLLFLLMEYTLDKTINKYEDKLPKWLKSLSNLRSKFIFINQLLLIFDIMILLIFNLLYGLFLFIYYHNEIVGSVGITILSYSSLSLICTISLFIGLLINSNNKVKDKLLQINIIQRLIDSNKEVDKLSIKTDIIWFVLFQSIMIVFTLWLYLFGIA